VSGNDDSAHGTPGLRARRQAAHRQLRRPRLVTSRERRRLRRAARRCGHERIADGAVPVGARRRRAVPRRGHRRAPHGQRRVGELPLGADHRTRRACSTATAASRARWTTPGTTPTSRRCGASAGRRWNGPSSGAST
jgi:hypothetical protein